MLDAQAGLVEKQLESLMVERKPQREEGFPERMIIMVGGCQKKHLRVAYEEELPVLPPDHELVRLYLQEAHERDHAGVDAMIMRSQSQVWITRIQPRDQAVKRTCFTCRRHAKELGSQQMAPLPAHRMGPTPPFWSTAVDLFGPLSIVRTVNRRTTRKVWGVIFVCTATSLTHVGVGRDLCMHRDVPDARGDSGVILNGGISTGAEEIHGTARGPQAVSVGPRNTAGCSLQAGEGMGLDESAPSG